MSANTEPFIYVVVESLEKKRQPLPHLEAVYILVPNESVSTCMLHGCYVCTWADAVCKYVGGPDLGRCSSPAGSLCTYCSKAT